MTARYYPIHKLASGGMADVYLGVQSSPLGFQRLVAIKKIKQGLAKDEDFLVMFRDEANVCQYLQHSNIVQIVDFTPLDDTVAIVLEFIPGVNLLEFLNAHRAMNINIPVPAALHIFCEMLKALAYVHERTDPSSGESLKIIHRDLTPTNIILSGEGEVKLTDFGIAKARDNQHLTQAGTLKGKLNYVSPEQYEGEDLDSRTDLYSAGLLLWEMLTGKRLYNAKTESQLIKLLTTHDVERNPRKIRKELDDDICSIVMTAVAIDPENRYSSARDLLKTMRGYMKQNIQTDFDLAAYVRRIMAKELMEHREMVRQVFEDANKIIQQAPPEQTGPQAYTSGNPESLKPAPMVARRSDSSSNQKPLAPPKPIQVPKPVELKEVELDKTVQLDQVQVQMAAGDAIGSADLPSMPQQGQHLAGQYEPAELKLELPANYNRQRSKLYDSDMVSNDHDRPRQRHRQRRPTVNQGTPPLFFYAQGVFVAVAFCLFIFRHEVRDLAKAIMSAFK